MKDPLSGVFSRYAYSEDIERYRHYTELPDNFTVFVFDINGLKAVNDNIGHDAGDELITGAARCIEKAVGGTGKCYRTGGDEFVVISNIEKEEADNILVRLQEETSKWSSDTFDFSMSIAAGYVREKDYQGLTAEELTKRADKAMYASKAAYYLKRL